MLNPIRALVVTLLMVIGSGPAMANNTIDPGAQAVGEGVVVASQLPLVKGRLFMGVLIFDGIFQGTR